MATAKPRSRASLTTSKYFSMNSARPGKTHSVPLRPGGGSQRANLIPTSSGVRSMPTVAPSGAGLAGIETRSIGRLGLDATERVAPSGSTGRSPTRTCDSEASFTAKFPSYLFSCAGHHAAHNPGFDHTVDRRMSLTGGHAMRTFDLTPLYRSTVGFDRLFSLLDQATGFESAPSYPPYNIERTGENAYRITVAVAGFAEPELSIEVKENTLTIRGEKQVKQNEKSGEVLYQGIAARAFERRFQLADHVEVKGAALENGLLHVDLVREIPEAMKPRTVPIGNGSAKVIDAKKAA